MAALSGQVENVWHLIICQWDAGPDSQAICHGYLIGMKLGFAGSYRGPIPGLQGQLQGPGSEAAKLETISCCSC